MRPRAATTRRNIVVGTDFSATAQKALARATAIASSSGATLHVVHAQSRVPRALLRRLGGIDENRTRAALGAVVAEVRSDGITVRGHLVDGSAPDALKRTAREVHADLVIVGSRGRIVPDAVIGSTAERVMATARVPVLLVRQRLARPYREVIVAADRESSVTASVAAAKLVAPGGKLAVLHAFDVPFESALVLQGTNTAELLRYRRDVRRETHAAMTSLLEKAGIDPRALHLRHGSPLRVLLQQPTAALLVIERSDSVARRLLPGSVTRWVVARGESDLLLV